MCSVNRRTVSLKTQNPVVSFCFDDFPRTAYSSGGTILRSFRARGTYYAALGLMGTSNELGDLLTWEDIESLLSDGHELGSHTFSHCSGRNVSPDVFERDALLGREVIQRITGCDAGSFAYPYGHVVVQLKKRLGAQMDSCRSIYGGLNGPSADLNLLRANSLYGDADQCERIKSLLVHGERPGGWLIFYTHDVRRHPSPFGCTPALLEKTLEMTMENGFRISPVAEVVRHALQANSDTLTRKPISNVETFTATDLGYPLQRRCRDREHS
jgi:peptidoglycan/xylan/chitin deacetylase (PgdA/CDA1 family)